MGQDLDREEEEADNNLRTSHDSQAITQSLFDRSRTELPCSSRPFVGQPLRPVPPELPVRSRGPSRQRQRPRPASASRARAPVSVPARRVTSSPARTPPAPTRTVAQVQGGEEDAFEYEYYYDYLDEDNSQLNPDYDLVPLAYKVTSSNRTYKLTLQVRILLWVASLPGCGRLPPPVLLQKVHQLLPKPGHRDPGVDIPVPLLPCFRPGWWSVQLGE